MSCEFTFCGRFILHIHNVRLNEHGYNQLVWNNFQRNGFIFDKISQCVNQITRTKKFRRRNLKCQFNFHKWLSQTYQYHSVTQSVSRSRQSSRKIDQITLIEQTKYDYNPIHPFSFIHSDIYCNQIQLWWFIPVVQ